MLLFLEAKQSRQRERRLVDRAREGTLPSSCEMVREFYGWGGGTGFETVVCMGNHEAMMS
ncbi:hypothetical protein DY000_02044556 [Brassica cretica]|uniref:Calcineurin-like phosphoesterase domain-containing protein n=1 Tax=Brassica cretica TaxID=69181 RepID=A0ABQ7EXV8_BRACR|nr:hypothetical protein DY000_02044556 [Brassica cretica]